MRLLIIGANDVHVRYAEWALLAMGADYHFETRSMEEAISQWPLSEFRVAVVVDNDSLHVAEDFLTRCKRTPYSPTVLCVGSASSAQVAALLELGADDFMPYDQLEDLGPTKVQVLLRRQRVRIKANKRASASVGMGRQSWRSPAGALSTVDPDGGDDLRDLFPTRRVS